MAPFRAARISWETPATSASSTISRDSGSARNASGRRPVLGWEFSPENEVTTGSPPTQNCTSFAWNGEYSTGPAAEGWGLTAEPADRPTKERQSDSRYPTKGCVWERSFSSQCAVPKLVSTEANADIFALSASMAKVRYIINTYDARQSIPGCLMIYVSRHNQGQVSPATARRTSGA